MDMADLREALSLLDEELKTHAAETGLPQGPALVEKVLDLVDSALDGDPGISERLKDAPRRCLSSYTTVVMAHALREALTRHALYVAETEDDPQVILNEISWAAAAIGAIPIRGLLQVAQFVAERSGLVPAGTQLDIMPPGFVTRPPDATRNPPEKV